LVPEVPNWTTVEEQFYSMFQASGGAGGVTREGIALTGQQGESATYSVTDHAAVIGDSGGNIDLGESQSAVHAAVIYFGHGSARLSRQDQEVLRQVAAAQQDYGGTVRVAGHASSRTKTNDLLAHKIANHETSLARARAVAKELIKLGVPRQSVFVEALSDAQPDYSEATALGEAANRRANVYIDFLTPPG
jgi:outer membrane protein OmpA-like peptidoglycan-associated protein